MNGAKSDRRLFGFLFAALRVARNDSDFFMPRMTDLFNYYLFPNPCSLVSVL